MNIAGSSPLILPPAGGGAFDPTSLWLASEVGDVWDATDITKLSQDTAGSTSVSLAGDVVGRALGLRGALNITQANTANKPQWQPLAAARAGVDLGNTSAFRSLEASAAFGSFTVMFSGTRYGVDASFGSQYFMHNGGPNGRIYLYSNPNVQVADIGMHVQAASNADNTPLVGPTKIDFEEFVAVIRYDATTGNNTLYWRNASGAKENTVSQTLATGGSWNSLFAFGRNYNNSTVTAPAYMHRALLIGRYINDTELADLATWGLGAA